MVNLKWTLWTKYKSNKTETNLNLELNIKSDPKKFWAHINDLKKRSGIPSRMNYLGETLCNPSGIIDAFAKHFSASFSSHLHTDDFQKFVDESFNTSFHFSSISESEVLDALKKLNFWT